MKKQTDQPLKFPLEIVEIRKQLKEMVFTMNQLKQTLNQTIEITMEGLTNLDKRVRDLEFGKI